MSVQSHPPPFHHKDNIWWVLTITKLLIMYFSLCSCCHVILYRNTFLSTLFWNTVKLWPFLNMTHPISPATTKTYKILVIYLLLFMFQVSKRTHKNSAPNDMQTFPPPPHIIPPLYLAEHNPLPPVPSPHICPSPHLTRSTNITILSNILFAI